MYYLDANLPENYLIHDTGFATVLLDSFLKKFYSIHIQFIHLVGYQTLQDGYSIHPNLIHSEALT